MAANYDLLLKSNDLIISNGDFVIAMSDTQHIQDSITAFPGWWKSNPLDGVGVGSYANGAGIEQELARKIDLELISDQYQTFNAKVAFDVNGKLTIDPNAVKL